MERFRQVVEFAPNALVMVGPAGNIEIANAQVETLFGYSRSELIGSPVEMLVPERYLNDHSQNRLNFMRYPQSRPMGHGRDLYGRRKDGRELPIEIGLQPVATDSGLCILVSIFDISSRRVLEGRYQEALARLQVSEDKFRSILGSIGEAIIIVTPQNGVIESANTAGAEMLEGAVTETSHPVRLFAGSQGERLREAMTKVSRANPAEYLEIEIPISIDKSSWMDVSLRHAVMNGKEAIVLVARDVTERRAMEAQLRQALKLEAIGTLAGGVAHELNNLLQPIIMMTELVLLGTAPGSKQAHQLGRVLDASVKASEIVRRILDFGRLDREKYDRIELSRVVREGLVFARSMLPSTIKLIAEIDDQVGRVLGDATQITQMVINLATNARDAIGSKIGKITVSLSRLDSVSMSIRNALRLGELKNQPYARLVVEDSGSGMSKETIDRIFEPFFTTKEVGRGTGLGLSVVRGIIARHNGAMSIQSSVNRGTKFTIYLPIVESLP